MQVRIKIITPLGNFYSDYFDCDKSSTEEKIKTVCHTGDYILFSKSKESIFIPRDMIQQSVIILDYK